RPDRAPPPPPGPAPVAKRERSRGILPPSAQPSEPPPGTPTVVISAKSIQDHLNDPQGDSGGRTIIAPPDFAMPTGDDRDRDDDDGDGATMMLAAAAIVII